eukprot:evm.model.scf_735EXC.6 EVM.evm.TU.scf_735EXC.6   scf_735EXC:48293-51064(+)
MKRAVPRAGAAVPPGCRRPRPDPQCLPHAPRQPRCPTDRDLAIDCGGHSHAGGIWHLSSGARSGACLARAEAGGAGALDVGRVGESGNEVDALAGEVEALRRELAQLRASRDADITASLAQYKELEEALALAQHELERSAGLRSMDADGVEVSHLMEVVGRQEATLEGLRERLEAAEARRDEAQDLARAAESEIGEERRRCDELGARCSELEGQLEEVGREAEAARAEMAKRLEEVRGMASEAEREGQGAREDLRQREGELGTLRERFGKLREEYERKCGELERVDAERKALEGRVSASEGSDGGGGRGSLDDMRKRYHAVVGEVEGLESTVKGLEAQVEEKASESKELQLMLKETHSALKQQNQRENRLKHQVAGLEARVEKNAEIIEVLNKEKREYRSELTKSGAQGRRLENELKQVQEQLAGKSDEANRLLAELKTMKLAESDLTGKLGSAQAEIEELLLKEIQQKAEVSSLAAKIVSLQSSLAKSEQDLHEQAETLKQREDELASARSRLEEAQQVDASRISDLERALSELVSLKDRQEGLLEGVSTERDALLNEKEAWTTQLAGLSEELLQAQETIADKDQAAIEAEKTAQNLEIEVTKLQESLHQAYSDLEQFNAEERKAAVSVASLEQELRKKQHSLQSVADDKQVLETRLASLEAELVQQAQYLLEAEQTVAEWQEKFAAQENMKEESVSSLMQLKEEAEAEVGAAAQLLTMAQEIANVLEEQDDPWDESAGAQVLEQQVKELQESLAGQADILDGALDRANLLQGEVAALEGKLNKERDASILETAQSSSLNGGESEAESTTVPSMASQEVHLNKVLDELRSEKALQYAKLVGCLEATATDNERIANLLDHTRGLEEENVSLRRALLNKRHAMSKARAFIEEFLCKQAPALPNPSRHVDKVIVSTRELDAWDSH